MNQRLFNFRPLGWKSAECLWFVETAYFLLHDPFWAYSLTLSGYNFEKEGQSPKPNKFSESWVRKDSVGTCPEKFSHRKFSGTEQFTKKIPFFTDFSCRLKKKYRALAPTILMSQTFPIASLNCYTPNFSGVPQKLTWCQQFGLQILPKLGDVHICPQKNAVLGVFLYEISFPGQTVDFPL